MQQGGQGGAGQLLPAVLLPLQMPFQTLEQAFQAVEARFLGLQLAVQAACVLPQGAYLVRQRRQEFPFLRQRLFQQIETAQPQGFPSLFVPAAAQMFGLRDEAAAQAPQGPEQQPLYQGQQQGQESGRQMGGHGHLRGSEGQAQHAGQQAQDLVQGRGRQVVQ